MKRFGYIFIGLMCLAGVTVLGVLSSVKPVYIFWFGVASAVLVPPAFMLCGKAVKGDDEENDLTFEPLPDVGILLEKAASDEERAKVIDAAMRRMDVTVRVTSRRHILAEKKKALELELAERMAVYDAVSFELASLEDKIGRTTISPEIERVQKMLDERERGRVIIIRFGRRERLFPVRNFGNDLLSSIALLVLGGIEKMQSKSAKAAPVDAPS